MGVEMKKLINLPEDVVREMLESVVALSPGAAILADNNIVGKRPAKAAGQAA